MVTEYLDRAGLTEYLDELGFNLVGLRLHDVHRQQRPAAGRRSPAAVQDNDLAVVSVLSGNRNFEGRINPDVKMNYLASPPLCVAYAIAGTMDIDLYDEPLGEDRHGEPVFLKDIWPTRRGGRRDGRGGGPVGHVPQELRRGVRRRRALELARGADRRAVRVGSSARRTSAGRRTSTRCRASRCRPSDIERARVLAVLGDSVTTDHISPAGSIKRDGPAARYLNEHGVEARDFNSYGSRRGNHEVMMRGTFANIRLRNQLAPGTEGGVTLLPGRRRRGEQMSIYDAAMRYIEADVPLIVLAGKEYGSGSSRDWAAKGTRLLGVRAVIAESFERIHRSNLVGMGVLPLQFAAGESVSSRSG